MITEKPEKVKGVPTEGLFISVLSRFSTQLIESQSLLLYDQTASRRGEISLTHIDTHHNKRVSSTRSLECRAATLPYIQADTTISIGEFKPGLQFKKRLVSLGRRERS